MTSIVRVVTTALLVLALTVAIEEIQTVPEPGYPVYRKDNDTWTYRAPLEIRDSYGQVRATYHPIVSIAARDGKIITAFPTR